MPSSIPNHLKYNFKTSIKTLIEFKTGHFQVEYSILNHCDIRATALYTANFLLLFLNKTQIIVGEQRRRNLGWAKGTIAHANPSIMTEI